MIDEADVAQAALCLWTLPGSWSSEVAATRTELCEAASKSFTDAHLFEDSALALKTFRALNLDAEDTDRPAKRRRTIPDSSDDDEPATYERLMAILNGSSEDSPVPNLANLHNIVQ